MGLLKFLTRKLRRRGPAATTDTTTTHTVFHNNYNGLLLQLSWNDIQRLTMDFATAIGHGGFSTVYLAQFRHSAAAVKIYCSSSELLFQTFKQELDILLRLRHRNIVKLLGYCDDREGVLVMEYVANGSLQEKLHTSKASSWLTWNERMAIAFQLAEAIAYLHESCSPHIVHGDIKPSNILLDADLNCKLCDFGSAKMGFSSTVVPTPQNSSSRKRRMMITGSPGYADPLYLRSGLASKKNDVYSFGVVVLELITGVEAFCPTSGERLTARAEPLLGDAGRVAEMMDPRLRGEVDLEEAKAMAALAANCISQSPGIRPSASDILTAMRRTISCLSFMFQNKVVDN
ncbi:hypothetical protein C2S52_003072 [Perilla frutescens var. hirtella]|nr:hypothetical protein C2S52_003072 [Perilla frutescens var. hirtella]